jgi:Cof subfamily protein (haloacid dehalogenase superfamily)
MMNYKILVSDIDGTLVENGNEFNESLISRIDEFRRSGGLFTIATGRTPQSAKVVVDRLGIDMPVVYMNGSLMMDPRTGKVIDASHVRRNVSDALLPWLDAQGYECIAFTSKTGLTTRRTQEMSEFIEMTGDSLTLLPTWDAPEVSSIHKVLVLTEESPEAEFMRSHPNLRGVVRFICSGHGIWEVVPQAISKGSAVRRLAGRLGLRMSQVVTVGDQMNDLEMTRMAGLGVAVENAVPELKKAAAAVTRDRCWRGVCQVLDSVLLDQTKADRRQVVPAVCVAS